MMMFGILEVIFPLMFFLVFGIIIVSIVRSLGEWNKNNNSPKLTVQATVVAKRGHVTRHHHHGADMMSHTTTSTTYYVTFQGTRYLGFERVG